MARFAIDRSCLLLQLVLLVFVVFCLFDHCSAIRCYKCKGDDECDFKTRQIYVENCTWATKCWGARIGDHYIRSCADDRCDIQIGVGSYVESKCCYTDMCNNENFFYPNGGTSSRRASSHRTAYTICIIIVAILVIQFVVRRIIHSC